MQLKITRSQRKAGMMGKKTLFALDVRAEYAPDEKEAINNYNLGGETIYSSEAAKKRLAQADAQNDGTARGLAKSMFSYALSRTNLNITIASLARGHHIECDDLGELLSAEEELREACRNIKRYLDTAITFDGREVIVDVA